MQIPLDWLGCATFRLTVGELVIFLDAYMDRVETAPPVGLSAGDVDRAGFILAVHSHFDHLAGAEVIAQAHRRMCHWLERDMPVMREHGVPREQLMPSQGGERHRLARGVVVRVYPSLHGRQRRERGAVAGGARAHALRDGEPARRWSADLRSGNDGRLGALPGHDRLLEGSRPRPACRRSDSRSVRPAQSRR